MLSPREAQEECGDGAVLGQQEPQMQPTLPLPAANRAAAADRLLDDIRKEGAQQSGGLAVGRRRPRLLGQTSDGGRQTTAGCSRYQQPAAIRQQPGRSKQLSAALGSS